MVLAWSACLGKPPLGDGGNTAVVKCGINYNKGALERICLLLEAAMPQLRVDFFHSFHQASDQIDSIEERVLGGEK